ncbi:hypothetical protein ANTPLA_LOCUS3282 [Anthophora plagiata]
MSELTDIIYQLVCRTKVCLVIHLAVCCEIGQFFSTVEFFPRFHRYTSVASYFLLGRMFTEIDCGRNFEKLL